MTDSPYVVEGFLLKATIVDDSDSARESVRRLLTSLADDLGIHLECSEYPSGIALVMDPPSELDILFIDIDMPHMNGLETVASMRKLSENLIVVLVTAYEGYAIESYSVQANRYLLKPVSQQKFNREIAPLLKEIAARQTEVVTVKCSEGIHVVEIRNIIYVSTTLNKSILIRTINGDLVTRGSLSDWEQRLPTGRFFRCHSGFLLNFSFVKLVCSANVKLTTGEAVPLSKHRRRAFLNAFTSHVGRTL